MEHIADLHIHSRYARACSKELTVPNIATWCRRKGIQIVATGDFTHPGWYAELQRDLVPCDEHPGLYRTPASHDPHFVCGTELACIYSEGGKVRRVHLLVFAPSLEIVQRIREMLEERECNIHSDGRPILGLKSRDLLARLLEIDPAIVLIPAHAWTPHFAVFGSKSGFDSLAECFGDLASYIHAIETGLSSDPAMNWRISGLDAITLISNSDAHSLPNLGREANVLVGDTLSYRTLMDAVSAGGRAATDAPLRLIQTLEFYPEEGKYHLDGHAPCELRLTSAETKKYGGRCPKCKMIVTVGVLSRIEALADRPEGGKPPHTLPYQSLVPLAEIISDALNSGKAAKAVQAEYEKLVADSRSEFAILRTLAYQDLAAVTTPEVVEGIRRVREGQLHVEPGYDGVYGTVKIFLPNERTRKKQRTLI